MSQALEQAWARHPLAAAAAARSAEARARSDGASSLTPGAASVSVSQLTDRPGSQRGRQEWELEVAAPLWLPGQKAARQAEAEAVAAAVSARQQASRLALAGELREAWWAVVGARQTRDLAELRSTAAQRLQDDVMRRYRAGDLSRVDANLAQAEHLTAQGERLDGRLALQQAEQTWWRLTGGSAPLALELDTASVAAPALDEDHPRLAADLAEVRLARTRLALAAQFTRASPELSLRAVRERGEAGEPYAHSVGVRLTIPLVFGPQVRQQRFDAQAELDQAETALARLREQLQADLARARLELQAAREQSAASGQRRELAADNLRLAEKSFALGEIDLGTLLRMRAAAFDAEAWHQRRLTSQAQAESRLRQTSGAMP